MIFVFPGQGSQKIGMGKDISAGAVMLASFVAVIIGVLLFGQALINYL